MHQEYVYVLTLIRAISYTPAFVPAGESLGCCLMPEALASSLTSALLYRLQAGGNETKKSIMKIIMEAPLFVGLIAVFSTVAFGSVGGTCRNCRGALLSMSIICFV